MCVCVCAVGYDLILHVIMHKHTDCARLLPNVSLLLLQKLANVKCVSKETHTHVELRRFCCNGLSRGSVGRQRSPHGELGPIELIS